MPTSKHRRKGKTRPRARPSQPSIPAWLPLTPEEQALEAKRTERELAFLQHNGRTEDQLSDSDWEDVFNSQAWLDWVGQHPLPKDDWPTHG